MQVPALLQTLILVAIAVLLLHLIQAIQNQVKVRHSYTIKDLIVVFYYYYYYYYQQTTTKTHTTTITISIVMRGQPFK